MQKAVPFSTDCNLDEVLSKPLVSVSLKEDQHGFCRSITLWHREDGITITSKMHDAAPRLEVGVLDFERASNLPNSNRKAIFAEALVISRVSKMLIEEVGVIYESGIRIESDEKLVIQIRPGGFPLSLVVSGVVSSSKNDFEYPQEMYRLADLTSIAK